jgi:hypothetical protein
MAEEQAARLQHAPNFAEHRPEFRLVLREVKHGAAEHRVGKSIRERHAFDSFLPKVIRGQVRGEHGGESAHCLDGIPFRVDAKHVAAGT